MHIAQCLCFCTFVCVRVHVRYSYPFLPFSSPKMESHSRVVKCSQQLGLPPRPAMTVTFSRDTLERKVEANVPQQPSRKLRLVMGNVGKISEKDADPVLVSLVNYHTKLLGAAGRSFDLIVGKLCHLLKTNGYYLDAKYKDTMDAMFFTIRSMILDQDKSELSRTRLLECVELRAKIWGHDPLELPQPHPQDLPSPVKAPEVVYYQDQVSTYRQMSPEPTPEPSRLGQVPLQPGQGSLEHHQGSLQRQEQGQYSQGLPQSGQAPPEHVQRASLPIQGLQYDQRALQYSHGFPQYAAGPLQYGQGLPPYSQVQSQNFQGLPQPNQVPARQALSGRYSPIPLPPQHVAPPSPEMVAMTLLAQSTPFPDDSDDDDDEWMTTSDMTYESDSSEEFIMPEPEFEVRDLMMESTSELDEELSRLLSVKLPDSYKRRVNDGKPVRYTRSFMLDLWKSPFSKEMPSVLRHTISHSDVSFIIKRHAFSDPRVLFQTGSKDDMQLMSMHLRSDPNMRPRRSGGRSTPEPVASSSNGARPRTRSWPQAAGANSHLDTRGGGAEGLPTGAEAAQSQRNEKTTSPNPAVWTGAGNSISKSNVQAEGQEGERRSPDNWRKGAAGAPAAQTPGFGSTGSKTEGSCVPGGEGEVSLRPQGSKDWLKPRSSAGILGEGPGPSTSTDWHVPGSKAGILGNGDLRQTLPGNFSPSIIGGAGDRAIQPERPGSSRSRSQSGSSQEGVLKVRFELPEDSQKEKSETDKSMQNSAPATPTSPHVLLTPRQILGEKVPDQSNASFVPLPDSNNNGYHQMKAEIASDTVSPTPTQHSVIPTFRKVFEEVIEKGLTTRAPGPAADIRAKALEEGRANKADGLVLLSETSKTVETKAPVGSGCNVATIETNTPNAPVGRGSQWTAKEDWN